jgi:putative phosphoesterase
MKIAVLSDAHGVYPALEAVWQDAQPFQPDLVLYAGDFTRGPYPTEVIHFLQSIGAHMVLGNDDINLIRFYKKQVPEAWLEAKQFGMARWTIQRLSSEDLHFLQSLPEQISVPLGRNGSIRIVHGSTKGVSDSINPDLRPDHFTRIIDSMDETVLVCGHSHRQWVRRHNGKLALNPGAVAGTRIGPVAQYARLMWAGHEWHVTMRSVSYDIEAVKTAFESRGLLNEGGPLARGYLLSLETEFDYMMAFLKHAGALAKSAGYSDTFIPDDTWEDASESFDWKEGQRTT